MDNNTHNKTFHRTSIPLRSIAASEFERSVKNMSACFMTSQPSKYVWKNLFLVLENRKLG
ncbi:MAG: hypothetical protein C4542_08425 [Dehalococcoidia bacterium]|nr:MAG: hypothetical protein C4542_08425 [Dehalococcoidia bacterium]